MTTELAPDLRIKNLGAHALTELALFGWDGVINVTAPSEAGKTQLLDALCFLLFGTRPNGKDFAREAIREGADKCEVTAALPDGVVAQATLTRAGSWNRAITIDGATQRGMSLKEFHSRLGRIGEIPDVARFVMAPFLSNDARAEALIDTNFGRPLRDLLLSALPPVDLRGVIAQLMADAGHQLKPTDSIDLKAALQEQTKANAALNHARGVLDGSKVRLASLPAPPVPPDDADVAGARAVLAARDAWSAYGSAVAANAEAVATLERYNATRAGIEARANAPLPAGPDEASVSAARDVLAALDAWTDHDRAVEARGHAVKARNVAEAERTRKQGARAALGERLAVPTLTAEVVDGLAKAPGFIATVKASVERLKSEADIARNHHAQLGNGGVNCHECGAPRKPADAQAAIAAADAKAIEAERALANERTKLQRAEEKLAGFTKLRDEHQAAAARAAAYDRELSAIGPDPALPAVPAEPTRPAPDRPTPEAVEKARADLRAADVATAERQAAERDRSQAAAALRAIVRPNVPDAPTKPEGAQPTAEDVAAAEGLIQAAANAARDAKRAEVDRMHAEDAVTSAQAAFDAATVEAARVATLVDVRRKAPTVVAEKQRAAFKLPDWIGLRFPPKEHEKSPEIEVLIDGRPWHLASTGRRILADLYFRASVREVAGLDALPLFVDMPMAWSGDYPDDIGRVVFLWTTQGGEGIGVEYVGTDGVAVAS
jgi:hypothetical protein